MELIPVLMFSVASTVTPGPNNFMMMNSGLHFGVKKSMPHYLGICFGFPLMIFSVAFGVGAVFLKYYWLKQLLKLAGSAYILYMAWGLLSTLSKPKGETQLKPVTFFQALSFQWINPKAWMMAIGAISIFSTADNHFQDALTITSVFLMSCVPSVALWLCCGTFLQKILKNERQQKIFNCIMALCLIASIGMMFVE